jgi:hypothetical protein
VYGVGVGGGGGGVWSRRRRSGNERREVGVVNNSRFGILLKKNTI